MKSSTKQYRVAYPFSSAEAFNSMEGGMGADCPPGEENTVLNVIFTEGRMEILAISPDGDSVKIEDIGDLPSGPRQTP